MLDEFGTDTLKMFKPEYSDTAKKIGASVRSGEDTVTLDFDGMKFCAKSLFQELLLFELQVKHVKQVNFINMNKDILSNALSAAKDIISPPSLWISSDSNSVSVEYM